MKTLVLSLILMFVSAEGFGQTLMTAEYPSGYSIDDAAGALAQFIETVSLSDNAGYEVIEKTESLDQIILKWTINTDDKDVKTETTVAYFLYEDSVGAGILSCTMVFNGQEYPVVESDPDFEELYASQKLLFLDTLFTDYFKLPPVLVEF